MKRNNYLLLFALILFCVPVVFFTKVSREYYVYYIKNKKEEVKEEERRFYYLYPLYLADKDTKRIETILKKKGIRYPDYILQPYDPLKLSSSPPGQYPVGREMPGEMTYIIYVTKEKVFQAHSAIAEEGIIPHFYGSTDKRLSFDENAVADNAYIWCSPLIITTSVMEMPISQVPWAEPLVEKGVKKALFIIIKGLRLGEKKYPVFITYHEGKWSFEEEERYLSALIVIDTKGKKMSKKFLRGIAVIFSVYGYAFFYSPYKLLDKTIVGSHGWWDVFVPYQAVRIFNEKGETLYSEIDKMRYPKEFIESQNKYIDELVRELAGIDREEESGGTKSEKMFLFRKKMRYPTQYIISPEDLFDIKWSEWSEWF